MQSAFSKAIKSTQSMTASLLSTSPTKEQPVATPPGSPTKSSAPATPKHHDEDPDIHMKTYKGVPPPPPTPSGHISGAGPNDVYMKTAPRGAGGGQLLFKHMHKQPLNSAAVGNKVSAGADDDEDIRMQTAAPIRKEDTVRALSEWELELLEKPEVKRKGVVAQLYFLDYYFDYLSYLANRSARLKSFKTDTASRDVLEGTDEYKREYRSYAGRERVVLRRRRVKLRVENFTVIAQVGQGGYGSVYLARKKDTGEVCALKKMRKGTLAKMDEIKHVLTERDILTSTKTPWLVRLLYAFQDAEHIYLAMEYVPGGDFRTLLNNSGVLKEEHARFYSAEMFMGVNELHKLGYIHRDLKPENFLVSSTGHVILTDFGLATGSLNPTRIDSLRNRLDEIKKSPDEPVVIRGTLERRTNYRSLRARERREADSVVGSPDYMPPEVLRGEKYSYPADYWSLGCILFEFLAGFPPFSGKDSNETWNNLKNWSKVLKRPIYEKEEDLIFNMSDESWDLITRLIASQKSRISNLSDLQTTPFFSSLPFGSLRERPAPFIPALEGETDVGYYDDFSNEEDLAKYGEVFEKQRNVDAVKEKEEKFDRGVWVGFTFGKNAPNTKAVSSKIKSDGDVLETIF